MSKSDLKAKPQSFFFILGRPRSGTSLLMAILDANPHTLIPPEIPIIPRLYKRFSRVRKWDEQTKTELLQHLQQVKFGKFYGIKDLPFDFDKIEEEIKAADEDTSFGDIIRIIYFNYASVFPKQNILILGDKNPAFSVECYKYVKIFPEAKFIHIRRDYRDHALSMIRAGFGIKSPAFIVNSWKKSLIGMKKFVSRHPDKVLQIKYESLVQEPETYAKIICDFLAIPFYQNMLEYHTIGDLSKLYPNDIMYEYQSSLVKPISTANVETFRERMPAYQIRMCDYIVGKHAEKNAYQRQYKSFYLKGFLLLSFIEFRRFVMLIIAKILKLFPAKVQMYFKFNFSILRRIMK